MLAASFSSNSTELPKKERRPRNDLAEWDEQLYLAVNADVSAAVAHGIFKSGREHYELAGRVERREGASVPSTWDEQGYLQANPEVVSAVSRGTFLNGYHHYLAAGRVQGRIGGLQPADWDEAGYLAAHPDARIRVALGLYRTGFIHYAALGRKLGYVGGLPASASALDQLKQDFPAFDAIGFGLSEVAQLSFTPTALRAAISTVFRQSEPAAFNEAGMRVWNGHDQAVTKAGGNGSVIRDRLSSGLPWLPPPSFQHCFSNEETGLSAFDPYRFMLRRAYAAGTDVRLFTTPLNAAVLRFFQVSGLYDRYERWLTQLVRINEEEAAQANRSSFPLWNFGDVNAITSEPIPPANDPAPMVYFWDHAHYRKAAGDLILDRVFGHRERSRILPTDFGVRLTTANAKMHLASSRSKLEEWATKSADLATEIAAMPVNAKFRGRQMEATCS